MALQINRELTTTDGGTVNSGSYVIFSTSFPARGYSYYVEIYIYRSLSALESGFSPLKVNEIPKYYYNKELTQQEFALLTPVIVHEDVKGYLEQFVGAGNVDIIL